MLLVLLLNLVKLITDVEGWIVVEESATLGVVLVEVHVKHVQLFCDALPRRVNIVTFFKVINLKWPLLILRVLLVIAMLRWQITVSLVDSQWRRNSPVPVRWWWFIALIVRTSIEFWILCYASIKYHTFRCFHVVREVAFEKSIADSVIPLLVQLTDLILRYLFYLQRVMRLQLFKTRSVVLGHVWAD